MCGIAGELRAAGAHSERAVLLAMGQAIAHRGPDNTGVWQDNSQGLGFVHRRLSIVDLTEAGHQPMQSVSGRYVITYNGEIYNHADLRLQLEVEDHRFSWKGHSDTETLLACFEAWGVDLTLSRITGMFAIGLWDRTNKVLILMRDRLGEKPLYYGWQGSGNQRAFLFGSELKALRAHPFFCRNIDRDALCLFMRHSYVPQPYSIYKGIYKLPPGSLLRVSLSQPNPVIETFWSIPRIVLNSFGQRRAAVDEVEYIDDLENHLKSAVSRQMQADVPLGAFLSGGIDSSLVVALMQAQANRPIQTFTIGFHEPGYNEAQHAKEVARHLGTDHTELYVSANQAMSVIPKLPAVFDEPFADSSQIPTYLVSALARSQVTVSLSGDGGDELFGGYTRYVMAASLWRKISLLPLPLRRLLARLLTLVSPSTWNRLAQIGPMSARAHRLGDLLHKGADVLENTHIDAVYRNLVSHWADPASVVIGGQEPSTPLTQPIKAFSLLDPVERMMALDLMTYLPEDILVKVDRAAMAVSLETRVPMLDHKLVEFAWTMPLSFKQKDGLGKWPLRQVLYRYVPQALIDRPKMGFGIPIDSWLRGPLRDWAESLLDPNLLRQQGYFHSAPIQKKWREHLAGERNWAYHIWDVLMFQAWLKAQSP